VNEKEAFHNNNFVSSFSFLKVIDKLSEYSMKYISFIAAAASLFLSTSVNASESCEGKVLQELWSDINVFGTNERRNISILRTKHFVDGLS